MGIPSYFNHIIKNHKKIFKKKSTFNKIHNLYLDSNSIIYDAMQNIDNNISNNTEYEKVLIQKVCLSIEEYIKDINPDEVLIAFDGVAPLAKLEQQRQRRYKSHFIKNIENMIKKKNNEYVEKKYDWNQSSITPGTDFMKKLDDNIKRYFKNPKKFKCENIIISCSDEVGEGEHKIFNYMRNNKEKYENKVTFIYGLDSDLIMLSLIHLYISDDIYLFRENPGYDNVLNKIYDKNELCIMNIKNLSLDIYDTLIKGKHTTYLSNENIQNENIQNENIQNKIYDYILIYFLLGNDFMPHIPSLNIRTNGISIIIETYKSIFSKNETIYDGEKIKWNKMKKLIDELAKNEYDNLLNEYKLLNKEKEKVFIPEDTKEELHYFSLLPTKNREIEYYIDPFQKGWEYRYYKKLFNLKINNDFRKQICNNYLEGLEWTMKYYTNGCVNYRWYYRYNYPPLLVDLIKYIPYFDVELVEENKNHVSKYTQLSYVLPGNSLNLLPEKIRNELLEKYKGYYSKNHTFIWAFCKYFWECHVELPYININDLEELVIKYE